MTAWVKIEDVRKLLQIVIKENEQFNSNNAKAQAGVALWLDEQLDKIPTVSCEKCVSYWFCKPYDEHHNCESQPCSAYEPKQN